MACVLLAPGCDCYRLEPESELDASPDASSEPEDGGLHDTGTDAGLDAGIPDDCIHEGPVRLDDGSGYSFAPHAVVDGVGRITVVWVQGDDQLAGSPSRVIARRCEPGSLWSEPVVVGDGRYAVATSNDVGEVLVTWVRRDSRTPWSRQFDPETGWADATEIAPTVVLSPYVAPALDSSGDALAVWVEMVDGEPVSRAATRDEGAEWSDAVFAGDAGGSTDLAGLAASDDSFLVGWSRWEVDSAIWTRRVLPGGTWEESLLLAPAPAGDYPHDIGVDARGFGIALFYSVDAAVTVADYDPDLGWGSPQRLATIRSEIAGWSLDVAADGTAVAAFGIDGNVFAATRGPGERDWGPAVELAEGVSWVRAAAAGDGQGIVAWPEWQRGATRLLVSRIGDGGRFGEASAVRGSDSAGTPGGFAVELTPDGTALALWSKEEADGTAGAWVSMLR